jgi:hypothetical protein
MYHIHKSICTVTRMMDDCVDQVTSVTGMYNIVMEPRYLRATIVLNN